MVRFEKMIMNMDESFLITETWRQVKQRTGKGSDQASARH